MNKELQQRLKQGLFKAIQTENEGYNFYMMAANNTEDEKGRQIFQELAEDELKHKEFLNEQYQSLLDTGDINRELELGLMTEYHGDNPIFSDNLKMRLGDADREMTALSIGIQLELNAIEFYREQAQMAGDERIEKFFQQLADWESGHYHALLKQHDALKEDYWNAAGFAPF